MYYRTLKLLFLIFLGQSSSAQDIVNFTQFFFNPYSINPSYAGIDGRASIALSYRKQWATIDGGPTVVNLSLHVPASKRLAVGLNVLQDTRGLLSTTGLMLSAAYSIPFGDESFFRFGLSGGGTWNTVDLEKLDGFSDNAISNILNNNAYLIGNAGISIHLKSFHAGVSFPVLFEPAYVSQDVFSITEVRPFEAFIVHASNRFYFNDDKYAFEPYILYRINTGLPSQIEVAGVLHLNHVLYLGGSYKQDFGISALGGVKLKNTLAIGASYSLKNTGINELNSPTYEVHLGYLFGARKKETPVYSFVNTEKEKIKKPTRKSASEVIAERREQQEQARKDNEMAALAKKQEDERKKKEAELARKRVDQQILAQAELARKEQAAQQVNVSVGNAPSGNTTPVNQTEELVPQSETHRPRFDHANTLSEFNRFNITEHTVEDEEERISRLALHADDPDEEHNDPIHPNAERHEFVSQGSHEDELPLADYVIGGVFREESNAAHFTSGLVKLGFKAGYGHLTEKAVWYVYLFQTDDINKAREERDRLRKTKLMRDCWLLTVQQ